jgi:hypothetical protein
MEDGSILVRIPAGVSPVEIRWGKSFIRLNTEDDEMQGDTVPAFEGPVDAQPSVRRVMAERRVGYQKAKRYLAEIAAEKHRLNIKQES